MLIFSRAEWQRSDWGGAAHPERKVTPPSRQAGRWVPKVDTAILCAPNPTPLGQPPFRPPKIQRARGGKARGEGAPPTLAQLHVSRDPLLKVMGAFTPPKMGFVPWGGCHNLLPGPQQVTFSAFPPPKKNPHLLLIPTTAVQRLPQMGGWVLPPTPCPDIWVSLSLHISSQHLKPFFSWQK